MGSTTNLVSRDHDKLLLQGTRELWEDSIVVDFTLGVNDEKIQVHKVILASVSGYFRSMFNSGMNEIKQSSVSLEGLTADSVKTLVNFVYTGTLQISPDTVQDIFTAAHYLQMSSAIDLCSGYIIRNLSWENVTEVENLAKLYALDDVQTHVKKFMFKNFLAIPNDVANSLGKLIVKLSGSNSLCKLTEMAIFEKLKSLQSSLSEEDFYEALCMVRFPLMASAELEAVRNSGVISSRSQDLLDEAVDYHRDILKQSRKQTMRTQVRCDDLSIVLATETSVHGIFVPEHEDCIPSNRLESIVSKHESNIVKMVTVDNFVYVCVNHESCTNEQDHTLSYRYDPRFDSWIALNHLQVNHTLSYRYDPRFDSWIALHHLQMKRTEFPFVAYQDQIFAIGGADTKTMEVYNIKSDKWRFCSDINYDNAGSEGVAMGNKIFVCGGHVKEENVSLDTLSCYDPADDSWKTLAPMNRTRHKHDVFALKGRIYVFRGDSGSVSVSMEYYNPSVDQWTLIDRELDHIYKVCLIGSVIYELRDPPRGGYCSDNRVRIFFEEYQIYTDCDSDSDFVSSYREPNFFSSPIPVKPLFDSDEFEISDLSLMTSSLVFPKRFWKKCKDAGRATHMYDPEDLEDVQYEFW